MCTVNVLIMLQILIQTCKNWEKKLITATMQNRTHIPLIWSLCSFKSRMEKVCKHTDHIQNSVLSNTKSIARTGRIYDICHPHPKNLAEQDSIDGVNRAIDSSPQRAHQHVGPFWLVVLEDPSHWSRLHMIFWIIFTFLLKYVHWCY